MKEVKTTIYDLAAHLNLSPSTVSRAINLHPRISETTILRVRRAMEELHYHPEIPHQRQGHRQKAFQLGKKTTRILLLSHSERAFKGWDLLPDLVKETNWKSHARLQIGFFKNAQHLLEESDAVILDSEPDSEFLRRRLRSKVVVQARGRRNIAAEQYWDQITYNNEQVGVLAAEYLISKGVRHAAIMIPDNQVALQRLQYFRKICEEHNVKVSVFKQPFYSLDHTAMTYHVRELLRKDPPVQGLFIFNTLGAVDLYKMLLHHGIRPDQDLWIISTDNTSEEHFYSGNPLPMPRSAVISIRSRQIYISAFNQLLWRLKNPLAPLQTITLEPELLSGTKAYSIANFSEKSF